MSDIEVDDQPVHPLVAKAERTMKLFQGNTERIRELWTSGEVRLPCHDACEGKIVVGLPREDNTIARITGFCPSFMEHDCPLITKAARELSARMLLAGFGERYHEVDVDRIRARSAIEQYASNLSVNVVNGRGLILIGDVGVGKTMSLAYLAKRMLTEDMGVWNVQMPMLINRLMSKRNRAETLRRLMAVQVLMLDDFGAGEMPTWVLGMLEGAVEYRYAHRMPVFVSSNMTKEALVEAPAFRRMVDRWRQTNKLIVVGGVSQRHD